MVKQMKNNKLFERIVHGIFLILGLVTVACVLLITVYLVVSGIPAIAEIGLWDFLFGKVWEPTGTDAKFAFYPLSCPASTELPVRWFWEFPSVS